MTKYNNLSGKPGLLFYEIGDTKRAVFFLCLKDDNYRFFPDKGNVATPKITALYPPSPAEGFAFFDH